MSEENTGKKKGDKEKEKDKEREDIESLKKKMRKPGVTTGWHRATQHNAGGSRSRRSARDPKMEQFAGRRKHD